MSNLFNVYALVTILNNPKIKYEIDERKKTHNYSCPIKPTRYQRVTMDDESEKRAK